jgi:hypothetical protein
MGKVSFSNGLAIGRGILAIVLIVLDKAGKLKGPVLFVLLAVAACMALPLYFSASWVTSENAAMPILLGVCSWFSWLALFIRGYVWISTGSGYVSKEL